MTIAPGGRGPQIIGVYSFFVGLTTVTLALRLYCRTYIQKAFGWDDYFAAFSWVSATDTFVKRTTLTEMSRPFMSSSHHVP